MSSRTDSSFSWEPQATLDAKPHALRAVLMWPAWVPQSCVGTARYASLSNRTHWTWPWLGVVVWVDVPVEVAVAVAVDVAVEVREDVALVVGLVEGVVVGDVVGVDVGVDVAVLVAVVEAVDVGVVVRDVVNDVVGVLIWQAPNSPVLNEVRALFRYLTVCLQSLSAFSRWLSEHVVAASNWLRLNSFVAWLMSSADFLQLLSSRSRRTPPILVSHLIFDT